MANLDQPLGFRPFGGIAINGVRPMKAQTYNVSTAPVICIYDLVARADDGYIDAAAAQSVYILGCALTPRLTTDAAAKTILVVHDPHQLYEAQADESDLSSITVVGNNADHIANTGSTLNYISKHEIDSSTVTGGAAGFHIWDKVPEVGNDWGEFVDVIVSPYEGMFSPGGTGYI
jgi:hypothetical protein